jgi:hypothetical protein
LIKKFTSLEERVCFLGARVVATALAHAVVEVQQMVCGVLGDGAKLVRAFGVFTDRSTASMEDVALVFPDLKAGVF